jgi:Sec-independent protein translocase protein TatA
MRISVGQILIAILIVFLLFGDFKELKKKLKSLISQLNKFLK